MLIPRFKLRSQKLLLILGLVGGLSSVFCGMKGESAIGIAQAQQTSSALNTDLDWGDSGLNIGPYTSITKVSNTADLVSWVDWYPIHYQQPEGIRVVNWWTQVEPKYGFSSVNVPNNISSTWPLTYGGKTLDYIFFQHCKNAGDNCEGTNHSYLEIVTQGDIDSSGRDTTLETWQRGSIVNPEIYLDDVLVGTCTKNTLRSLDIHDPNLKEPYIFLMPNQQNSMTVGNPVCLTNLCVDADNNNVCDYHSCGSDPACKNQPMYVANIVGSDVHSAWPELIISVNKTFTADKLYAFNTYMAAVGSEAQGLIDYFEKEYCQDKANPMDAFHCLDSGQSLSVVQNGTTYKPVAFEEYWMNKTTKDPVTNIIHDKGFYKFRWYGHYFNGSWESAKSITSPHTVESCTIQNNNFFRASNCVPYSPSPTPNPVDFNHDGQVDYSDYQTIVSNFTAYSVQLFNRLIRVLMS